MFRIPRRRPRVVVASISATCCLTFPLALAAQQVPERRHVTVSPDSLVWRGSNGLELATVYGDPNVEGAAYGVMLRLQPGRWIQPHWHPHGKGVVVVSGKLLMGMGSTLDSAHVTVVEAGGYAYVPAETRHFEGARELTVVMLYGIGPLITYPAAMADSAVAAAAKLSAGATSVTALRESYLRAYNAGDAKAMEGFYTSAAVRMAYDAPAQTGRDAILAWYRSSFATRTWVPTLSFAVAETRSDGTRVVERGTYHEELAPKSGAAHLFEDGKYVAVMERGSDGRWRFVWSIFNRDKR